MSFSHENPEDLDQNISSSPLSDERAHKSPQDIVLTLPPLAAEIIKTIPLEQNNILDEDTPMQQEEKPQNELKHRIFVFLTEPTSSRAAFFYQLFQLSVILLSSIAFVISSEPEHWEEPSTSLAVSFSSSIQHELTY